jgi:hypothetical protein
MRNIIHTSRTPLGENEHRRRIASHGRTRSSSYHSQSIEAEVMLNSIYILL